MDQFFLSFSLILGVVLLSLGLIKLLKQPMLIAYILAGTIIAFVFPSFFSESEIFNEFSQVGIVFLLFIIGTELSPATIQSLGIKTVSVGVLQVIFSSLLGFCVGLLFGYDILTSLYIGTATALSSTIVILKLLGDKDELDSTYGRLSIGISVSQDIFVMLFMSIVATFSALEGGNIIHTTGILLLKIIGLTGGLILISKYILPHLTKKIAESQEFLLLFSIGWCFMVATIVNLLGFGFEIGALFAGLSLATSPYKFEITSRMKVLKDFFIVIYFVLLGSHLGFNGNLNWLFIISGFILVVIFKPWITMYLLKLMGHVKKNNFLTGITEIPMSEFSFILISMGIANGSITDPSLLTMITIVGISSILISGYTTTFNHQIFKRLGSLQKFIPGSLRRKKQETLGNPNDVILFGYGRLGTGLFKHLEKKKYHILVIDEHPSIINHLNTQGVDCLYGDALDLEFLQDINLTGTKMVISTILDIDVNIALLKILKEKNNKIIVIGTASHIDEAIMLYEKGLDYVIMPHYIGADHTSVMLEEFGLDIEKFLKNKSKQIEALKAKSTDSLLGELMRKK